MILEIQEYRTPTGGMLTFTQDISERKWAEQSLRDSAEFQRTLLETMPLPAFHKNFRGEFLGCNAAYADFFGLSKADVVGKTVDDLMSPELAKIYKAADEDLIEKGGGTELRNPDSCRRRRLSRHRVEQGDIPDRRRQERWELSVSGWT